MLKVLFALVALVGLTAPVSAQYQHNGYYRPYYPYRPVVQFYGGYYQPSYYPGYPVQTWDSNSVYPWNYYQPGYWRR